MPAKRPIFLFAFANDPKYRLKLEKEERVIRRALQTLDSQEQIEYKFIGQTSVDDIFDILNSYHDKIYILHYGGHSQHELILLSDQKVGVRDLGTVIGQQKNLKLVFLNGCANQAQVKFLLDQGIPAVIATTEDVSDQRSIQLAQQFYKALAAGKTLGEAFDTASSYAALKNDTNYIYRGIGKRAIDSTEELPWGLYKLQDSDLDWSISQQQFPSNPNSKYFEILPITDVQPVHFLESRAKPEQGFHSYYLHRAYLDERLSENFVRQKATIVTGKPLAGKTRSVFELCDKVLKENHSNISIYFLKRTDIDVQDFDLPQDPNTKILFLDDLEQFLSVKNLEWALEKILAKPNFWVVATCRESELHIVEDQLAHLYHNFEVQKIHALDVNEKEVFESEARWRASDHSDGTVGSYLLPIDEMRRRYKKLPKNGLAREILYACKGLRLMRRTNYLNGFSIKYVKEYCQRRYEIYYLNRQLISPAEWDHAIEQLVDLGLLELDNKSDTAIVEELYLERFILVDEIQIRNEYVSYFPTVRNFSILVYIAPNWTKAEAVIEQMQKAGVKPDEVTYNSLLTKAPDWTKAEAVIEQMQKAGVKPDEVTYNSLLTKAPDWTKAEAVIEQMQKAGVKPNEVTYNSLLTKAPDWTKAEAVIEQMQKAGVKPNEVTYSSLLTKAPDWTKAEAVIEQMQKAGVKPDEVTYNSLLTKAPDWTKAEAVIEQMQKAGVKPDEVTYSSLLTKAPDWTKAEAVIEQMQKAGVKPNEVTYNSLLTKAPDWTKAQAVIEQMQKAGVKPDEVTYNSLLTKAPDWTKAQAVIEQMQKAGVKPNEVTYSSLLTKAPDWTKAEAVIEQMQKAGVKPNEVTYNSLLTKAPDWTKAEAVIEQMQKAGVKPDEVTYNSLLTKAPDWTKAQAVIEQIQKANLKIDRVISSTFLKIAKKHREVVKHELIASSPKVLFQNVAISIVSKEILLPELGEEEFFSRYFEAITKNEDRIIYLFCHAEVVSTKWRQLLLEDLRTKDWRYFKTKADSFSRFDSESTILLLKEAEQVVPENRQAQIHAIWAKTVVYNDREDLFPEAISRCRNALKFQPTDSILPYTGKLLIWLLLRTVETWENCQEVIEELVQGHGLSRKLVNRFLSTEIWQDFPNAPIEKYSAIIKQSYSA